MNGALNSTLHVMSRRDVLACVVTGLFFFAFPDIDIWVSQQFYDGEDFYFREHTVVSVIYHVFANIHFAYLIVFTIALLGLSRVRDDTSSKWRKRLRFLLLVLVLVPGLVVNIGLKDNSFGRPRPVHIAQFGGQAEFAPAFVYSGECAKNCSFVSGHVAIAAFIIAFAWIFSSRSLFVAGLLFGLAVGVVRVLQGGHFLSDVIFSVWVVYFGTLLLAKRYQFTLSRQPKRPGELSTGS